MSNTNSIKKVLRSYIFEGILLILLGVAVIIWPQGALKTLCIVIGIVLGVMGIIKIVSFFVDKTNSKDAWDIILGGLLLGLGVALCVASGFFITLLQYITAFILLYGAIILLVQTIRLSNKRGIGFVLAIVFSFLMFALAIIIFINPMEFASFITILYGISFIIEGIALIFIMGKANRMVKGK